MGANKSKFKVGDRVRTMKGQEPYFEAGDTGAVLEVNRADCYINFDTSRYLDGRWYVRNTDLKPIEVADSNSKPTLKAGDRVRVTHTDYPAIPVGTVTHIVNVDDEDADLWCERLSCGLFFFGWEFELLPAPLFAVGDKVRCKSVPEAGVGIIEEVKPEGGYAVNYKDTWYGICHDDDEHLEPLPAPPTIAAGKYYRTRDGRRVGPMRKGPYGEQLYDVNVTITGYGWEVDGSYIKGQTCDLDLTAEWPDPAPVVAEATTAKFKVGDIVRSHKNDSTTYRITEVDGDELHVDALNDDGTRCADVGYHPVSLFYLAPTTAPAIVCRIDNGQPMPANRPFVHASRADAAAEAKRLAGNNKGREFGVYELVDTAKEERTFEHEWQRLAVGGQRIAAIRTLKEATGMGLRPTKDAVEYFLKTA